MSQKKPTLGRGLADLLGHSLRPLQPVSVAVPVAGKNPANGTASPAGAAAAPAGSTPANVPGGSANAAGSVPYAPHAPTAHQQPGSAGGTPGSGANVGAAGSKHGAGANTGAAGNAHSGTVNPGAAATGSAQSAAANSGAAAAGSAHGAAANPGAAGAGHGHSAPGNASSAANAATGNARSAGLHSGDPSLAANAASLAPGDELARLPVDLLQKGKYQPRIDMRQETLQELADSIKAQGVIQPIVVRPVGVPGIGESQRYEIIAGERRWRAAQMAGLSEIPAVVRRIPDEAAIAVALIENIQRENLNPLEEARALERLISEFDLTHQEAADAVGRSRSGVTNLLRLLELAPEVCERVEHREIEMGHARAIGALSNRKQQVEVATLVAKRGLSVRDTEALVRRMQAHGATAAVAEAQEGARDPNVQRLEQELADKLGAKVAIQHSTAGKGKLVVSYNSLDELDGILAHIQ
jgi:ParB family chromosome partitioning protein